MGPAGVNANVDGFPDYQEYRSAPDDGIQVIQEGSVPLGSADLRAQYPLFTLTVVGADYLLETTGLDLAVILVKAAEYIKYTGCFVQQVRVYQRADDGWVLQLHHRNKVSDGTG